MNTKYSDELLEFINQSPTAFNATLTIRNMLEKEGYKEIKEEDLWKLNKGDKYYLIKNNSAIIAMEIGNDDIENHGFRLIGAHTDSPTFKIKPCPEMTVENTYLKLNTEVYGGPILSTWFDRPLSLAGRVVIKGASSLRPEEKIVNIEKPLLIIPSLAIHMNRSVNEGVAINKQKDVLPLLGLINKEFENDNYLLSIIEKELGISKEEILDFDLYLYEYEKGTYVGMNQELISASRLDDLWMVFAGIKALIESEKISATKVMICIDNEEIGSLTAQGANSALIERILKRISLGLGKNEEEYYRALSKSVMISADLAHALHPNYVEKHDPVNRPVIGKGPVIKMAASGSYSTDARSSAIFINVCKEANVPYQMFVNRSDVRGGTTIGPVMSSKLNIPVIDMGAPLLGMHSIRELASVYDNEYTIKAFNRFYSI